LFMEFNNLVEQPLLRTKKILSSKSIKDRSRALTPISKIV